MIPPGGVGAPEIPGAWTSNETPTTVTAKASWDQQKGEQKAPEYGVLNL